jgi:sugar phosphate permease
MSHRIDNEDRGGEPIIARDPAVGEVQLAAPLAVEIARSKPLIAVTTRVTILLSLMYLIMYLDRVNISMAAKAIMKEFSLSNTQLGFAFSAFFWPYFIGQLFGGYIAKHIGSRLTLILCGTLVAVTTICTGFIAGLMTLMLVRFGLGCGEGPAWSGATSAMSDWYDVKKFGFIQGITHSASRVGMTIAPPIVAFIMLYLGWRSAFIFCGLLSVAWVIAWSYIYRDNPRTHPLITEKELAKLPPVSKVTKQVRVPTLALAKRIAPVMMCQFTYGVGLWLFVSWLPLYFMNKHGLNLKASALLSALTFGAGLIGDALGGVLSDHIFHRTGNKRLARNVLICTFLLAAAAFLYATMLTHNLTAVTVIIGLSFFFLELTVGPMWAVPMDITRDFAGIAAGMMNFGAGLAGIVSPPVIGWLLDKTGNWDNPFLCIVGTLALGGVMAIFLRPDKPFVWSHDESVMERPA